MEMFDSIIFDIDGTLWDSRDVVALAWQAAVKEHTDLPADFDGPSIGQHFGKPMIDIFKALYPGITEEKLEEMTPYLYEYEHKYLREYKPSAYPGIESMLKSLSSKYALYIVTNGQKGYTEAMLDATGLGVYFKGWLSYGDTLAPKYVTIRRLMEQQGICHTCYIGDTTGDQEASEKAGIPFLYCSYGLGEVKHARYQINAVEEMEDAIHKMEQDLSEAE